MRIRPARPVFTLSILLVSCFFAISSPSETFKLELKYVSDQDSDRLNRCVIPHQVQFDPAILNQNSQGPDFKSLVKKEPDPIQCKYPFRGVLKLGSIYFPFLFDSTDLGSNGFEILYLDRNRNGDLTDDPVIKADPVSANVNYGKNSAMRKYSLTKIPIEADGIKIDHAFTMMVYSNLRTQYHWSDDPIFAYAQFRAAAYREGEIKLDGKSHRIVLLDFNSSGLFNNEIKPVFRGKELKQAYTHSGDMILLDPDPDDKARTGYNLTDRKERHPVSKLFFVDGRYYQIQISPSGHEISIEPSTLPLGSFNNLAATTRVTVYDDKLGLLKLNGDKTNSVPVPAGSWKLAGYTLDLTDYTATNQQGRFPYTYLLASAMENYPPVSVEKGQSVELPFGPPYKPVVTVQQIYRDDIGPKVSLALSLVGIKGEVCSDMYVDGKRPEKPTFAITNSKGKILERGAFEYG